MKVLYIAGGWAQAVEKSERLRELKELTELETVDPQDEQALKEKAKDADIIVTGSPIRGDVINVAKKLKMIQTTSVGYEYIDEVAATANGVIICNVVEANANSVAELCFVMILDIARRISAHDRSMREGEWGRVDFERQVTIRGSTLGIVGLGAIGSRMAQIGKHGFNMQILASDPFITEDRAEGFGAKLVDLHPLMKESDVVTVHVPLMKETRHLIGEKELNLLKPTAIFINAARGSVVDEQALIKILTEKKISGAGLDVYETEPLPKDSPLRKLDNVVIVPHIGSTPGALRHMREVALWNVVRMAKGQRPMNIQTPGTYYISPRWAK